MMKHRIIAALLFSTTLSSTALAQQNTGTISAALHRMYAPRCGVAVQVIPSTGASDPRGSTGREFEAILLADAGPSTASGSLWINASGKAYRVPFVDRAVFSGPNEIVDPIVFRLPQSAALENVFIESTPESEKNPCTVAPWVPNLTRVLPVALLARFAGAPLPAATSAVPVADPAHACHTPDAASRTLQIGNLNTPAIAANTGVTGEVEVSVALKSDSTIAGLAIRKTANPILNESALAAAEDSVFQSSIHNCRPLGGTYLFVVEFQSQ